MSDSYNAELKRAYNTAVGAAWKPNVCPGSTCKLCGLIRPILNFQDQNDEALVKQAKDMAAKNSYFSNVCFDPDYDKVMLFSYGQHIMNDLSRYQVGPTSDYVDFAHPETGRLMVIHKSIGSNGYPQYSVTPKVAAHKLPPIPAPHNLKQITKLLGEGVEYLPQAKLDVKDHTVRFIGYGVDGNRFFKTVKLHWSISPEEYDMVQQGQYNPFNVADVSEEPVVSEKDVPMFEAPQETPAESPVEMLPDTPIAERMAKEVEPTPEPSTPPCFTREYDPEDEECMKCKSFAAACQEGFLKKYGG